MGAPITATAPYIRVFQHYCMLVLLLYQGDHPSSNGMAFIQITRCSPGLWRTSSNDRQASSNISGIVSAHPIPHALKRAQLTPAFYSQTSSCVSGGSNNVRPRFMGHIPAAIPPPAGSGAAPTKRWIHSRTCRTLITTGSCSSWPALSRRSP